MIPVAEARARILAALAPVPVEWVALADAFGRVLAEPVFARRTQPPFDVSAMDGWAVRASDVAALPARLRITGAVRAGTMPEAPIGMGGAMRIFTGAPLPSGADTIVLQEDAATDGDFVTVIEAPAAGRHIRRKGLDLAEGSVVASAGRRLSARDIALIAAANVPWVAVRRRPRIGLLSTGDELVRPGEPIGPSQIVSTNGLALSALVRAAGGDPVDLGIAADEPAALLRGAAAAAGCDLLVTLGGASVGDHDLVRPVLAQGGSSLDFWKIAMRPGKPLMFGRIGAMPLLGLPGNPVSSYVCALVFLLPALAVLSGAEPGGDGSVILPLGVAMPAGDQRQDYVRARIRIGANGRDEVVPAQVQDSSMLSVLAGADGLIVRPPLAAPATTGDPVPVLLFRTPMPSGA